MPNLNTHQKMAVQALENLQEICDRYGLKLFLLAGTTLGAVRHKGMIPWDDDIDIGLTYEDWIKLRAILPEELDSRFEYLDYESTPGFPRLFGKILYQKQNCIDVFLIAKWTMNSFWGNFHWQIRRTAVEFYKFSLGYKAPRRPTTTEKQFKHYKRMRQVRYMIYLITKPFCNTNSYIRLAKWNETYYERHPYDCYINLYSIYKMEKERIEKSWIEKTSIVEFEGRSYTTVGDTDAYLTHLYGDYMTLPPITQRVGSHSEEF